MAIPDNGLIKLDGRVGPFWEHYLLVAPVFFWGSKIAWTYGYADFWTPYVSLVILLPVALFLHLWDKRRNAATAISDKVDQTVPLAHKLLGIFFLGALGITAALDYRAVSAQAQLLRESQAIVDSVSLKES